MFKLLCSNCCGKKFLELLLLVVVDEKIITSSVFGVVDNPLGVKKTKKVRFKTLNAN
jgi:hypothetical protein